tara:strand:+ start:187 stop:423 length:237 start_codon:yes stop_codon:yes gene_type:complete
MLGPVACFTCGKRLGSKWNAYNELVKKYKTNENEDTFISLSLNNIKPTPEGKAMDELGIKRYCCRRIILGNIDIIENL